MWGDGVDLFYEGNIKAQREYRKSRGLRKEPGTPTVRGSEGDQDHTGPEAGKRVD